MRRRRQSARQLLEHAGRSPRPGFPVFPRARIQPAPDSCGRGKFRGGLGFLRRYEILKDGVRLSFFSDRFRLSTDGLFGGEPGATGYLQVPRGGKIIDLKSKAAFDLVKGDIVTLAVGGRGGYGRAAERLQRQIDDDVEDGIISDGVAREWKLVG
jgi:N-methylhydantoinase B